MGEAETTIQSQQKPKARDIVYISVISLLCAILLFVTISNMIFFFRGLSDDGLPTMYGGAPLIVLSSDMEGDAEDSFDNGSLIIVRPIDPSEHEFRRGEVISFRYKGNSKAIITSRIKTLKYTDGKLTSVVVNGDAQDDDYLIEVAIEDVLGVFKSEHKGVGDFIMFMGSAAGIALTLLVPSFLCGAYILIRYLILRKAKKASESEATDEDNPSEISTDETAE